MLVLPLTFVLSDQPKFANYTFMPWLAWLGAAVFALALWLFYRTHHDLGRNWSVTLEIREQHKLITSGVYSRLRHPMYSAFWLWALAQALLLPNWIAGTGRSGRLRHAVLVPDRARGANDGGDVRRRVPPLRRAHRPRHSGSVLEGNDPRGRPPNLTGAGVYTKLTIIRVGLSGFLGVGRVTQMRIAFGIVSLFPGGGLQRDCLEIARLVRQRGHAVTIYTERVSGDVQTDDIPVVTLSNDIANQSRPAASVRGRLRARGECAERSRRRLQQAARPRRALLRRRRRCTTGCASSLA